MGGDRHRADRPIQHLGLIGRRLAGFALPQAHAAGLDLSGPLRDRVGFYSAARMPTGVVLFSIVMGLLWLSTVPPTNSLVAVFFGTRYLGMLGGIVFFSHQIGSFLGVWLGGVLYDAIGSYDSVWWLGVALGIFAAIVHWPIAEKPVPRLAGAT